MGAADETEPMRGVKIVPNFNAFLWDKLNKISEAWDAGDYVLALQRTYRLVFFLPTPVKKELKEDIDAIRKELEEAYSVQSIDFFTTHLSRNKQASQVAMLKLESFINKMVELLDRRGYLEFQRRRLESKDLDRLEREAT